MKLAVLALPRFAPLKQLIVRQLAQLHHTFHVIEERVWESLGSGLDRLEHAANVERVLVDRLDYTWLVDYVERHRIDQVISFSDRGVVLAARVRERFGMRGNSAPVEARVAHKGLMRRRLHERGLSRVAFRVTSLDRLHEEIRELPLPVIVKPASLGASFCVQLIDDLERLPQYMERCRAHRVFGNHDELIIEEYLPGRELSVEGLVTRGHVEFLGVTETHTSGSPYFVGTGFEFFAKHEDAPRIQAFVTDVIRCLQLDDCPFQVELKCVDDGFEVIEAHTRYGGAMLMELVEHATGVPVFSHHVETLTGSSFDRPRPPSDMIHALHLLCTTAGVIDRIRLDPEVTEDPRILSCSLYVSDGDTIAADVIPLECVGHVSFRATDRADAQRFRSFVDHHFSLKLCT
jgi:predicted ATP-grasp superfamily ATP-dependent carboligase